jgi:hypothetical protein
MATDVLRRRYGFFDRWLMRMPVAIAMLGAFAVLKAFGARSAGSVTFVVGLAAGIWGWLWVRRRKYPPEVVEAARRAEK